jgi:hypothetical protein
VNGLDIDERVDFGKSRWKAGRKTVARDVHPEPQTGFLTMLGLSRHLKQTGLACTL